MTKRIKLVVSYDGTDFCGWAAQTGLRTVQGTLKEAVRQISGEDCEIVGASRTDSGAHARGQLCDFTTDVAIEPERWASILNRALPSDVMVIRSVRVPLWFNSRFCVDHRWYRYRIVEGARDPFRSRWCYAAGRALDLDAMKEGASRFVGRHDFRALTADLDPTVQNTFRELYSIDVKRSSGEIWIDVRGTAFLRGMMRRIAGTLVEIGSGKRKPESVERLLNGSLVRDGQAPVVLPAHGLTLMQVRLTRPLRDTRIRTNDTETASQDDLGSE